MPEINGMELLKPILDLDPTLSVVLLTAEEERDFFESLIGNGSCVYLKKILTPASKQTKNARPNSGIPTTV